MEEVNLYYIVDENGRTMTYPDPRNRNVVVDLVAPIDEIDKAISFYLDMGSFYGRSFSVIDAETDKEVETYTKAPLDSDEEYLVTVLDSSVELERSLRKK